MWIVYRDEGTSLYQMIFQLLPGPVPLMVPSRARRTLHRRPSLLRTLLQGVLSGLRTLHTAGVTHRDVKLENVFVAARCWAGSAGVPCGACAATACLSVDNDDSADKHQDAPLPFCAASVRVGDFGCVPHANRTMR